MARLHADGSALCAFGNDHLQQFGVTEVASMNSKVGLPPRLLPTQIAPQNIKSIMPTFLDALNTGKIWLAVQAEAGDIISWMSSAEPPDLTQTSSRQSSLVG